MAVFYLFINVINHDLVLVTAFIFQRTLVKSYDGLALLTKDLIDFCKHATVLPK